MTDFVVGKRKADTVVKESLLNHCVNGVIVDEVKEKENVFDYINRTQGRFCFKTYQQLIGAANEYKDGDMAINVAAYDEESRLRARKLLGNTSIKLLHENPLFKDALQELIWGNVNAAIYEDIKHMRLHELKEFILSASENEVKHVCWGLNSDVIACVVKLMSNDELIQVGKKIFNPLPNSSIGSKGYFSARVQPNSPTDNPTDIAWQVFNAWSLGVGDLMLGTNPVDSTPESVYQVEIKLRDIIQTFEVKYNIENLLPWVVLAHVDVQAVVESKHNDSTALWFQSLAGTDSANKTFDLTIDKLKNYTKQRNGPYAFYFETGQGADYTNGHDHGFDMVVHESRIYGFALALKRMVIPPAGQLDSWVVVNDVAGFIGPEVFKTRDQLLRVTLEDTVMGKLHGLTHGLDVCCTLHMNITLDDLQWVQDHVAPANPSYLMALPTRNDPMLSYLTTSFQDHVRIRDQFGYKINDKMEKFFKSIGVLDANGNRTAHFGDPLWVYYQYQLAKGSALSKEELYIQGAEEMQQVLARGVPLSLGHGATIYDLEPELEKRIRSEYTDAKLCLRSEFTTEFINSIAPLVVPLKTNSVNRDDYILHPKTGEVLSDASVDVVSRLAYERSQMKAVYDVQIVVSDGLSALSVMDDGHLSPYLSVLMKELMNKNLSVAPEVLAVVYGRVRVGYRIGEVLFNKDVVTSSKNKCLIHIIGERPGTMHRNYSVYIAAPTVDYWSITGHVDHDIVKVISGISDTATLPGKAAVETVRLIEELMLRNY